MWMLVKNSCNKFTVVGKILEVSCNSIYRGEEFQFSERGDVVLVHSSFSKPFWMPLTSLQQTYRACNWHAISHCLSWPSLHMEYNHTPQLVSQASPFFFFFFSAEGAREEKYIWTLWTSEDYARLKSGCFAQNQAFAFLHTNHILFINIQNTGQ